MFPDVIKIDVKELPPRRKDELYQYDHDIWRKEKELRGLKLQSLIIEWIFPATKGLKRRDIYHAV